jgi:DNA-binding NarL/FixJ family response regulator
MRGKTMEEMEQELFVAQGTIKAHMNHIYRKFGVHSRKELIDACREDA